MCLRACVRVCTLLMGLDGESTGVSYSFVLYMYVCFVDLSKAYSSINCEALWKVLDWRYHFPPKLICILKVLHVSIENKVQAYRQLSYPFPVKNGVRQGNCARAHSV